MKAIGIVPGTKRLELLELEKPQVRDVMVDAEKVLIEVKEIGISAIDRRIAAGEPCEVQPGAKHLVLGHEAVGRLVQHAFRGDEMTGLHKGDLVVPMVRRGCGLCFNCIRGNHDLCLTGSYEESGIHLLDGYMSEYIIKEGKYVIGVPSDLEDVAVLLSPLSLVERAVAQGISANHRMDHPYPFPEHSYHHVDWGVGKTGVVVGGTDVAILAALLFRINSLKTYLIADNPGGGYLASLVEEIGATYIQSGAAPIDHVVKQVGRVDMIIEATGAAKFDTNMLKFMGECGVMIFTTVPGTVAGDSIDANSFMRALTLRNQIMLTAASANHRWYELGLEDLRRFKDQFGSAISKIITHRYPFQDYEAAFAARDGEFIKAILETGD